MYRPGIYSARKRRDKPLLLVFFKLDQTIVVTVLKESSNAAPEWVEWNTCWQLASSASWHLGPKAIQSKFVANPETHNRSMRKMFHKSQLDAGAGDYAYEGKYMLHAQGCAAVLYFYLWNLVVWWLKKISVFTLIFEKVAVLYRVCH